MPPVFQGTSKNLSTLSETVNGEQIAKSRINHEVDRAYMQCGVLRSAKIALAFGILAFLFWRTFESDPGVYAQLKNEAKDWPLLTLACLILLCSSPRTFFRWYLLVRILGIPFSLWTAVRLGFVGYFFNFFRWVWWGEIFLRRSF